jgi:SAM-dependent methyltransferase
MAQPSEVTHPIRRVVADEARKAGSSVLEVGCNIAMDYRFMEGLEYVGVDFQERFLERARELHPGIHVQQENALHLTFMDRSFDTVYCKDLLEHLAPDTWRIAVAEMNRVARHLIMVVFFRLWDKETGYYYHAAGYWDNTYNKDEVEACLREYGGLELRNVNGKFLYLVKKRYQVKT